MSWSVKVTESKCYRRPRYRRAKGRAHLQSIGSTLTISLVVDEFLFEYTFTLERALYEPESTYQVRIPSFGWAELVMSTASLPLITAHNVWFRAPEIRLWIHQPLYLHTRETDEIKDLTDPFHILAGSTPLSLFQRRMTPEADRIQGMVQLVLQEFLLDEILGMIASCTLTTEDWVLSRRFDLVSQEARHRFFKALAFARSKLYCWKLLSWQELKGLAAPMSDPSPTLTPSLIEV